MKCYVCCKVCGKVFGQDGIRGGVFAEGVPTLSRSSYVVCRPEFTQGPGNTIYIDPGSCRATLEAEINRLVWEEGYQGLVTFGPRPVDANLDKEGQA